MPLMFFPGGMLLELNRLMSLEHVCHYIKKIVYRWDLQSEN
jgi:hypothetical protein